MNAKFFKEGLVDYVKRRMAKNLPIIFYGPPKTGKTILGNMLTEFLGVDVITTNESLELHFSNIKKSELFLEKDTLILNSKYFEMFHKENKFDKEKCEIRKMILNDTYIIYENKLEICGIKNMSNFPNYIFFEAFNSEGGLYN